jgi:predicted permease
MNTPVRQKSFSKIVLTGFIPLLILITAMFYVSYENNRAKELLSEWIWLPSFFISTFIVTIGWFLITNLRKSQNKDKFSIVQFFFIFVCFFPINHWVTSILKGLIE